MVFESDESYLKYFDTISKTQTPPMHARLTEFRSY